MKIVWNKVTWYSKLIALALFVALPFIGFWLGAQYGEIVAPLYHPTTTSNASSTVTSLTNPYYINTAQWQTETRLDGGFSIAYPIDFQIDENYSTSGTTDWRVGANGDVGLKLFTLTIPSAFEPGTNFADATLTVGKSSDPASVLDCMKPDAPGEPGSGSTPTTINGVAFEIFKSNSAGAGNYYETTSYRTVYADECYAVEYTIHSSQIANYPSQYDLQPFNEGEVTSLLDRIVGTFRLN